MRYFVHLVNTLNSEAEAALIQSDEHEEEEVTARNTLTQQKKNLLVDMYLPHLQNIVSADSNTALQSTNTYCITR